MLIARTPLRISFFGGGTDIPEFFLKYGGGAVLGSAINQFIFHSVTPFQSSLFDYSIRLAYRKVECVSGVDEIEHAPFRECLKYVGIDRDIEIDLTSNLPSFSGMGSSSSFTVGLLNALMAHQGKIVPKLDLAYTAIELERKVLKEAVGCQDQVFAAVGGFNLIEFLGPRDFVVNRVPVIPERLEEFEASLMVFFTGIKRRAHEVERKKIEKIDSLEGTLKAMLPLVDKGYRILTGSGNLSDFGGLLDQGWKLKRELDCNVSNSAIDHIYESAMAAGALGGKLLGAGGGGFMLLWVPQEKQGKVRKKLSGYSEIKIGINAPGSSIVFHE